jgi:hypothetical protein
MLCIIFFCFNKLNSVCGVFPVTLKRLQALSHGVGSTAVPLKYAGKNLSMPPPGDAAVFSENP